MPATPKDIYDALVAFIATKVPGFQVRFKSESWSQRLIGKLAWIFNKKYMTGYTTTIYPYVYFPTREFVSNNYGNAARVLTHEYVHLFDNRERPLGFRVQYAMPQLLAVLALGAFGAFWTPWALLSLVALLALAPWPSSGRTAAELRGYAMSMAVDFWPRRTPISAATKEWVAQHFTSWDYYRMCPNNAKILAEIEKVCERMASDELLKGPGSEPYLDIYLLYQKLGLIKVTGAISNA
jgi:hypothetical protein